MRSNRRGDPVDRCSAPQCGGVSLPGNSPIMQALIEPLLERGWQAQFAYLGQPTELNIDGVGAIINCICDASIQKRSLAMLQELMEKTSLRVINSPASIFACTRERLVPGMHSGVKIPLTTSYHCRNSDLEQHLIKNAHQLPVLVRPVGMHNGIGLERIETVSEFIPDDMESEYYVTDFVNFISPDNLYRKYRLIYVAGQIFHHHLLVGKGWCLHIKDVKDFMQDKPALMEEARYYINDISDEATARLSGIFENLGLDFGMVDYALDNEGQPIVFEVNPCFLLTGVNQQVAESVRGGIEDISQTISEIIFEVLDINRK